MPNPNAEVSIVRRFDLPAGRSPAEELRATRRVDVDLESGRRTHLDPADRHSIVYAQVLETMNQHRRPVYLEIDPETSAITLLLIPYVTTVLSIQPLEEERLAVWLARSHARHVLRRDAPDFDELEARLREAMRSGNPVIVTENDAHEIIDVRYPTGPADTEGGTRVPLPRRIVEPKQPWFAYIVPWLYCISAAKAAQVFNAMSATSCNPLTAPAPCIPFLYPYEGCFARAHEMCRLMIEMGLNPGKVWIKGDLHVETDNDPLCYVDWGWHVAPTLCVRGRRFPLTRQLVIDPALFSAPVTRSTWMGVQGDPNATLKDTSHSIYFDAGMTGTSSDLLDPNYSECIVDLAIGRSNLLIQTKNNGPPPYACGP